MGEVMKSVVESIAFVCALLIVTPPGWFVLLFLGWTLVAGGDRVLDVIEQNYGTCECEEGEDDAE